jgi:hypothetical protein
MPAAPQSVTTDAQRPADVIVSANGFKQAKSYFIDRFKGSSFAAAFSKTEAPRTYGPGAQQAPTIAAAEFENAVPTFVPTLQLIPELSVSLGREAESREAYDSLATDRYRVTWRDTLSIQLLTGGL